MAMFENFQDLLDAVDDGKISLRNCLIYFDGGTFDLVSEKYGKLIDDGNPEEALAAALGVEIGIV